METYPRAAAERAMKIQERTLRAVAKKILAASGRDHRAPQTQHNKLILPFPQLQYGVRKAVVSAPAAVIPNPLGFCRGEGFALLWRRRQQRQSASSPRQIGRKSEWKPPLCHNATVCTAR